MDRKVLSLVRESSDRTPSHSNSLSNSGHPKRVLRRNCSDSDILDKDVPSVDVEGRTTNFNIQELMCIFLCIYRSPVTW